MSRMTEVMFLSRVCSKGSILLNGSISKPISTSSRAADIPDVLHVGG